MIVDKGEPKEGKRDSPWFMSQLCHHAFLVALVRNLARAPPPIHPSQGPWPELNKLGLTNCAHIASGAMQFLQSERVGRYDGYLDATVGILSYRCIQSLPIFDSKVSDHLALLSSVCFDPFHTTQAFNPEHIQAP